LKKNIPLASSIANSSPGLSSQAASIGAGSPSPLHVSARLSGGVFYKMAGQMDIGSGVMIS
jgi:hypothetical protein